MVAVTILKRNVCETDNFNTGDDGLLLCSGRAVISDCDSDFRDIRTFEQCEKKPISLPSQKTDLQRIVHLTPDE